MLERLHEETRLRERAEAERDALRAGQPLAEAQPGPEVVITGTREETNSRAGGPGPEKFESRGTGSDVPRYYRYAESFGSGLQLCSDNTT
jgi:hypothetical protein